MVDSSDTFFGDQVMDRVMLTLPTSKEEVYDCFFNVPDVPMQQNPLNMNWIAQSQAKDARTKELRQTPTKYYHLRPFAEMPTSYAMFDREQMLIVNGVLS